MRRRTGLWMMAMLVCCLSAVTLANVIDEANKSFVDGDYATVKALMMREVEANPGHEEAYILLAKAHEKLGEKQEAAAAWSALKRISNLEDRVRMARLGILRNRGLYKPDKPKSDWKEDPFKVDLGSVDWRGLGVVENSTYDGITPPLWAEGTHFVVFTCNQRLADVVLDLTEQYLEFLTEKFLDGRGWAARIPILIYKDHSDYVSVGKNMEWSGGVTIGDRHGFGGTERVALYALNRSGEFDKNMFLDTLPHELTHVVINEFFGSQGVPRWLNEALARRLEQERDHYMEAAKVGRGVLAGEYFRLRDLFAAKAYPDGDSKLLLFYEQSATVVLFLLEQGPDAMLAFLEALRDGKGHDAAVAAALGIDEEGAIEVLETRWVEWSKNLYAQYLNDQENADTIEAEPLSGDAITTPFDGLATVESVSSWTDVPTTTLDGFRGLGDSRKEWSIADNRLRCSVMGRADGSILGIRTDDEPPMVLELRIRATENPPSKGALFGIAMLDHRGDDTGIQVMVRLRDKRGHKLTCVVADDITVYLDEERMGQARALRSDLIDEDIYHPLGLVAYHPVEIWNIRTGLIQEFVESKPKDGDSDGS